MKVGFLALSVLAAIFQPAFARAHGLEKRVDGEGGDSGSDGSTIFNDVRVPPMKELNAEGFEDSTKDGYWCVPQSPN